MSSHKWNHLKPLVVEKERPLFIFFQIYNSNFFFFFIFYQGSLNPVGKIQLMDNLYIL